MGRAHHRLQPRAAETVDRLPGDADGKPGEQGGHAADVAIVLAGLVGGAHDHVVDQRRVDPGPVHDGAHDVRGQVVGPDLLQRAAIAAEGVRNPSTMTGVWAGSVRQASRPMLAPRGEAADARGEAILAP